MRELPEGLTGEATMTVRPEDTAIALKSGDVDVLGTPRLLALCEEASVAAIAAELPPDQTSVGARAVIRHRAPSRVGAEVVARATLDNVVERHLRFEVVAYDGDTQVLDGHLQRVIVDRSSFGR